MRLDRSHGLALAALAVPLLILNCSSSEAPAVATTINVTPSPVTLTAIGRTQQFTAVVLDQRGATMPNATVTWASSDSTIVTVSATGLGTAVKNGTAQVQAKSGAATGNASVTVAQLAAQLTKVLGDGQPGLVGYNVNVRPAVRLTDAANAPVSGAAVTFAVASGGGSGTGLGATTNSNGVAQVASWTLGGTAGVNTMTATVSGLTPVTFSDTGLEAVYQIKLQYYGSVPVTLPESAAFNAAITKWQTIIYRHVSSPVMLSDTGHECSNEPPINQTVTDILIMASFDSIDGPGKTLAQAGPCFLRIGQGSPLTVMGIMKFDTADVAGLINNNELNLVVEHEMGHVLGFGTVWEVPSPFTNPDCLRDSSTTSSTQATYFACGGGSGPLNGLAQFDSLGGTSYTGSTLSPPGSASHAPPLENCGSSSPTPCGTGTINSHWLEPVFGNELMTGFINTGANPLSSMTAAAMQDIGYTVNYAGADLYTKTFTAPVAGGVAPTLMGDDLYHGPLYGVDPFGRVVLIRARQ